MRSPSFTGGGFFALEGLWSYDLVHLVSVGLCLRWMSNVVLVNDEEAREAEQRIDDQLKVLADKLAAKTPEIEDLYLKKAWMVNDIAEKVGANRKAVMMVLTVRGHIKPHSPRVNPDLWIWRKGCDDAFSGHLSKIGVEATLDAEGYEIYDLDECYQAYRNGIAFRSGTNLKKRK